MLALVASSSLRRGRRSSSKACYKSDQIASIVQPLVIDRPAARRIRRTLDQKDRAADRDSKRLSDDRIGRGRLQLVFGLDQRRVVLTFQQCEHWLGFKIVLRNLLPYISRQVRLVEGHRYTIRQTNTLKPDHQCSGCQCKLMRN